jgi:cell division protein FtsB
MTSTHRIVATIVITGLLLVIPRWVMQHPLRAEVEADRARVEALRAEVDDLRERNAQLVREVSALSTDPRSLERRAREELFFVDDGEVVLVFPEEPDATTTPDTP